MSDQMRVERYPDLDGSSPFDILGRMALDEPLLFLGSESSPYSILALSFEEETRDHFMFEDASIAGDGGNLPFTLGQVALLTYDAYNPWCGLSSAPCRFFRTRRALVWDKARGETFLAWDGEYEHCDYQVKWPLSDRAAAEAPEVTVEWRSTWTDAQYLEAVAQSLEDIREGRFYQINLLRFWEHRGAIGRPILIKRLRGFAGPFAAFIDLPDLGIVSWSPERFIQIRPDGDRARIEAEPVKGTRPVVADPGANRAMMDDLLRSAKDKAELHMIIDLMRNDLQRICDPGAVKVLESGALKSFPSVHHLVGRVEGRLKPRLKLDEICRAVCPGGSITGAPKREVMDVIHRREERERGYFMGNILYRDLGSGRLDSSILIRTAVRHSAEYWEYAAGSGITVKSHAYEELQEVLTKARIILENPW